MKRKRRKQSDEEESSNLPSRKDRFTVERFLHGIGDPVLKESVIAALGSGYQLSSRSIPFPAVPAILILACFSREYADVELVDDYDNLVEAMREAVSVAGQCAHPDLYLASCIAILHGRDQVPTYEGFVEIKIDKIFAELTNMEFA